MDETLLPSLDRLLATLPADLDALATMRAWFLPFAQHMQAADARAISLLLLPDAFWRDMLALTWDLRTFHADSVLPFLRDRLPGAELARFVLDENSVQLQTPHPGVAWIFGSFAFESSAGRCAGIARLVPTADGTWRACAVFTDLDELRGHPARVGALRESAHVHGKWAERRRREVECLGEDEQPAVVIIGAGQSGLEVRSHTRTACDRIGQAHTQPGRCALERVGYDYLSFRVF
jgi:hypothetical protein